ncbi:unnamed protein product [Acanthosepion pharaonis]|uniref:Uncharacterized protein n=1 Tax=Acanthosepion pharaonis TaxID=158019 RepID=A0A812EJQ7_ACAPH|nr:unnamed protein product [Sepia pharaonis]
MYKRGIATKLPTDTHSHIPERIFSFPAFLYKTSLVSPTHILFLSFNFPLLFSFPIPSLSSIQSLYLFSPSLTRPFSLTFFLPPSFFLPFRSSSMNPLYLFLIRFIHPSLFLPLYFFPLFLLILSVSFFSRHSYLYFSTLPFFATFFFPFLLTSSFFLFARFLSPFLPISLFPSCIFLMFLLCPFLSLSFPIFIPLFVTRFVLSFLPHSEFLLPSLLIFSPSLFFSLSLSLSHIFLNFTSTCFIKSPSIFLSLFISFFAHSYVFLKLSSAHSNCPE